MPAEPGAASASDAALRTTHLTVPRSARIVTAGPPAAEARAIWYALHGYGQLARTLAQDLLPLARASLLVVPEALSRFYTKGGDGRVGASWMTRDDRETEIADYVRYLDLVHAQVAPPAGTPLRLLGFSQGTATACRWAAYGASVPPDRVVLWGGNVPPDLDWDRAGPRLRHVRFTLVHGRSDPFLSAELVSASRQQLEEQGVAVELVAFEGGHHLDAGVLRRLAD